MKYSMFFEYEQYIFEVDYTYEKGIEGDGWMQPDDDDEIFIEKIKMVYYITENNKEIFCKSNPDVQYLLSQEILNIIDQAVWDDIEKNEHYL